MASKFTLFTVPHTGTHFARELFITLGAELDWDIKNNPARKTKKSIIDAYLWQIHAVREPDLNMRNAYEMLLNNDRKLLVTARDPILGALHYMSQGSSYTLDHQASNWATFLDKIQDKEYFAIDIGCTKELRYKHLCDAFDFLEINNYDKQKVKEYAENWTPRNTRKYAEKEQYLQHGILPDLGKYSWDMLKEASEWYKSLPTNDFGDK